MIWDRDRVDDGWRNDINYYELDVTNPLMPKMNCVLANMYCLLRLCPTDSEW